MRRPLQEPHLDSLPQKQHETYEGASRLIKELPILGRMHLVKALPNALRPDRHIDEYEIHYVVSGTLTFWVGDETYEVRPGMGFLTQPNELHGGVDAILQPGEWYWLRLRLPPAPRSLPSLSAQTTQQLRKDLARFATHLFVASDQLRECFLRLIREHRERRRHAKVMARLLLHEFIVTLIRDLESWVGSHPVADTTLSPQIQQATEWIQGHLTDEFPPVDEIASQVGLSESHFRRRFHDETGFSPVEYITRHRVNMAKQLLRAHDRSITTIAFDLGFQSSGYFAQVFRRLTGMTPSRYRELHGGDHSR